MDLVLSSIDHTCCRALVRAAANYANASQKDAIEAAHKRITRIHASVQQSGGTRHIGIGSDRMGWVVFNY